jgi:hypothetical protein
MVQVATFEIPFWYVKTSNLCFRGQTIKNESGCSDEPLPNRRQGLICHRVRDTLCGVSCDQRCTYHSELLISIHVYMYSARMQNCCQVRIWLLLTITIVALVMWTGKEDVLYCTELRVRRGYIGSSA